MTDILQQIALTRYPKKAELPDIEAACVQRQFFLEREELTMPALKENAAIHCYAHAELAVLYFLKARILYQTRASKVIARALLEGTIQNELTTILTLTATSIPDELPLGEDPYDPSQMEEAYRTMTDPDWRQALRHHYRLGLWGMRVILMHNWKGQRCRELSMGTRYSLQVQMPSIAEAILQGRSKPFSP